ncbi:MAG: putative toxin-antitoxin system toxin component, PIN family [Ignavibacteria bacterium]|nr:putative toxin-antitoxin system toxin component, PIN family [Ignavibacteria bacterium]
MKDRLKVVLDTNVLLVSISSKSKYHWIFDFLIHDKFDLFITNEILNEYDEVISRYYDNSVSRNIINTLLILPNVFKTDVYFNWNLIPNDFDDNKFVDCVISSNSHLLVTNDKHFQVLNSVDFPKVKVAGVDEFEKLLNRE